MSRLGVRRPAGWVGEGNGGKQRGVKGSGKWFYMHFLNSPLFSVVAAWPVSLARYVVSPGEMDIEPRCGFWDIDNALLMILEINSFSVILKQRNEKIEFTKLCFT